MRRGLLRYLVCPSCEADLTLQVGKEEADDIVDGRLACDSCGAIYPIIRSIPRMIQGGLDEEKRKTANAFGWEWQEFSVLHGFEEYRRQFLDWISPLTPVSFVDKVVLDAGCGMGRFAVLASAFGAKDVLAIDLSDAVEPARANSREFPNVHVIQADIYRLPFRRDSSADIDLAYSIGVLHHLPNPERGFGSIVSHIKPGGSLFAWVYGYENNEWIVRYMNPLRQRVFSRLPRAALYFLSLAVAVGLHPVIQVLYSRSTWGRHRMPYFSYLHWLAQYGFRHTHHVIFDHLVAPTAFYIPKDEFAGWFERSHLELASLTWRNSNSWRGLGRRSA